MKKQWTLKVPKIQEKRGVLCAVLLPCTGCPDRFWLLDIDA